MSPIVFADRVAGITGSLIDQIMSILPQRGGTGRSDVISFGAGSPGPDALPGSAFRELSPVVLAESGLPALNYGPTEGDGELREQLLKQLRSVDAAVAAEQLVITTGAMQGLDLVCKLFINPGDLVAVESPAFTNALATIGSYQGEFLPVTVDADGMVVDELAAECHRLGRAPKLIYVNPNFQNPTGVTLSLERRKELLSLAANLEAIVLEDDPYGWLGYQGQSMPSLYKMSGSAEWVVGVHTFSKIICPGVRVGWCVGSPEIIGKMVDAKQGMDTMTNMLAQRLIAVFLREGRFNSHLKALREVYRIKRDAMCESLADVFGDIPEATWTMPEGGFFIWLTLPSWLDTESMFTTALDLGVAYVPGRAFATDDRLANQLRLSFTHPTESEIREGVLRLRAAYDATLSGRESLGERPQVASH